MSAHLWSPSSLLTAKLCPVSAQHSPLLHLTLGSSPLSHPTLSLSSGTTLHNSQFLALFWKQIPDVPDPILYPLPFTQESFHFPPITTLTLRANINQTLFPSFPLSLSLLKNNGNHSPFQLSSVTAQVAAVFSVFPFQPHPSHHLRQSFFLCMILILYSFF